MTMLDRRQKKVRRALAGGALVAIAALVPLWLVELTWVLAVARPGFDSQGQGVVFCLTLGGAAVGIAAVVGAIEALVLLGVNLLATRLAKRRTAEPHWTALFVALLSLPAAAVVAARMFAGRRASQIPGKHFIAVAVGIVGVAGVYGLARLVIGARERLRIRAWGRGRAVGLALLLLATLVGLYVVDQRVLPRLYPFFHVSLGVGAFIAAQLLVAVVFAGFRPSAPWMGRLAEPQLALIIFVGAVSVSGLSLRSVTRSQRMMQVAQQHAVLQSKVLWVARKLGLARGRLASSTLAGASAGSGKGAGKKKALVRGPRAADASLLLITIDALRADHMGIYGYKRKTTPHIDAWATKRAVVFKHGYASVPHTSFSLTSLLTGAHMYSAGAGGHRTLTSVLRRYGYKTAGFFPPAVFYIDRGRFAGYRSRRFDFEYVKFEFLDARRRVDQVLAFLRAHRKRKVFVWAHFFEPHEPYKQHPGHIFGSRAVDRYDSEIAAVDTQVGRLLREVRKLKPKTAVAITGDHGEAFGEHGSYYHGNTLYQEQVRVPLLIAAPGVKARRVDGPAQTIDIAPTLLTLVDIPVPASMEGHDLGPWLAGERASRLPPAYAEIDQKKAVIAGRYKLIHDTSWGYSELYDLVKDPGERDSLAGRDGERTRRMRALLARLASSRRRGSRRRTTRASGDLFARARRRDPGAAKGLARLLRRGGLEQRRRAARALTRLRVRSALPALVKATGAKDPGLRIQATVGAALLGDAAMRGRLPKIIARRDLPPGLRRDALLALAAAGNKRVTPELCRILERSRDIYERLELIRALGALGDPRAALALRGQLKTLRTRREAILALGMVRARTVVPELIAAMRTDRFISVREHAAHALGRIGDPRAVTDLRVVVRRELEPSVVARALESLATLDALPIRGVQALSGRWRCSGDVCRMKLPVRCDTRGELLVLLAGGRRDIEARCGDKVVGRMSERGGSGAARRAGAGARAGRSAGTGRSQKGTGTTKKGKGTSKAGKSASAAGPAPAAPRRAPAVLVTRIGGDKKELSLTATAPAPRVRYIGLRSIPGQQP